MPSRPILPVVAVVVASVVAVGCALGGLAFLRAPDPVSAAAGAGAPPIAVVESPQGAPAGRAAAGRAAAGLPSRAPAVDVAATPGASSQPGGSSHAAGATQPSGPIDPAAIRAGFARSPYTFATSVTGFPSYGPMGSTWRGTVADPSHFEIDFDDDGTVTRYVRDGAHATAYLGHAEVSVAGGDGWVRTPDDMLPLDLYAAAIERWTDRLPDGASGETRVADSDRLTAFAHTTGLDAQRWALAVSVDTHGRLTSAVFSGLVGDRAFRMALEITYLDLAWPTTTPPAPAAASERQAGPTAVPSRAPTAPRP